MVLAEVLLLLSQFSRVRLFMTLWTVAFQAPLPMGFSRQEYWSGLHALPQGIFLTQRSNPGLLHLLYWQAGSLPPAPAGTPLVEVREGESRNENGEAGRGFVAEVRR